MVYREPGDPGEHPSPIWSVLVLHGPNLNLLGTRQPQVYGASSLDDVNMHAVSTGRKLGAQVECRQSNAEGELIDWLHEALSKFHGVVINPGGLSHTSVALRDAIASIRIPTVEVHLSHIHAREPFRRRLVTAPACIGIISGFGAHSYALGLWALIDYLERPR